MCSLKTKDQITNAGDVNSLITGLIFRQCVPFTELDICNLIKHHYEGAKYKVSENELFQLIRCRLDTFERNDYIKFQNGQYYPASII